MKNINKYNETLNNVTQKVRELEMNGIKDQTDYTTTKNMIDNLITAAGEMISQLNGTDGEVEKILQKVS